MSITKKYGPSCADFEECAVGELHCVEVFCGTDFNPFGQEIWNIWV
jgi:hypothetical protein